MINANPVITGEASMAGCSRTSIARIFKPHITTVKRMVEYTYLKD